MTGDKLIINAAITGAVLSKAQTPHVPVTPGEIVDCACRIREAGAAIVHLHSRAPDQTPAYDADAFCELVARVRQATDLVVCVSLSGRFEQDLERRSAGLAAAPELASLTLGSLNFKTAASINAPDAIVELAGRIYAAGAIPELEVFEAGFANYAKVLISQGILRAPYYFNLICGSLGSMPLDLVGLGHLVGLLPPGAIWSLGGVGRYQLDANVMGMAAGGHVRVGLEDNLHYDRARTDLADNARLVARIARIGRELGREPATPAEARQLIGIAPARGKGASGA